MQSLRQYADLCIRLPVGFHLIYGTQDNIFSWQRMLEFQDFLLGLGVPFPLFFAHLSVYAQFVCGILFIVGWKVKWAAILMIINFTVAIGLVHLSDTYPEKFPAIFMLASSLFFLFYGDGKYNLEYLTRKMTKTN